MIRHLRNDRFEHGSIRTAEIDDVKLRAPVFIGLRTDVDPGDCVLEGSAESEAAAKVLAEIKAKEESEAKARAEALSKSRNAAEAQARSEAKAKAAAPKAAQLPQENVEKGVRGLR